MDAGYNIHSLVGPGALGRTYRTFLAEEIRFRGLPVRTEVPVPASHRGAIFDVAYRIGLHMNFHLEHRRHSIRRVLNDW